jgi:hypothetical protein
MQSIQHIGFAPRTKALARDVMQLGPCVGCKECKGMCKELLELMSLPDVILKKSRVA